MTTHRTPRDPPPHESRRAADSWSAPPPWRAAAWRSAFTVPFGDRAGRRRSRRRPPPRGQRLGGRHARRHLRDPHRALRDGAGHDHRPRPARRRGARVRLEEGRRTELPTPGQNLARKRVWGEMGTGGSRGIRTSRGLRPPRRRRRADDAAAGGRRPVERAGRRAHGVERRHHARRERPHDDVRQGRRGRREADAARPEVASSSRTRGRGRSPASR